jgi:hypothetical protein
MTTTKPNVKYVTIDKIEVWYQEGFVDLLGLFGDMGMVGSARLISEAGVRRPWSCP